MISGEPDAIIEGMIRVLALALLLLSPGAFADEAPPSAATPPAPERRATKWIAQVSETGPAKIEGLQLVNDRVPVFLVQKDHAFRPMVTLEFALTRTDGVLSVGDVPLPRSRETGRYVLFAYLNSQQSEASLSFKGPGKAETARFAIFAPEAQEFKVVTPWDALRVAVGGTLLGYKQTGFQGFYSWNGLLAVNYRAPQSPGEFGFISEAEITALTVNSNQDGLAPQLAHVRAEGSYAFPPRPDSSWRYQALAGGSWMTILANGAPFGFRNLTNPTVGALARWIADEKTDYTAIARLVLFETSLKQLGTELEVSRSLLFKNLHRGEIGLKFLGVNYRPDEQDVSMTATSLFLSYTL